MSFRPALALAALALAGCATATQVGTENVDASYVTGGGNWDTGGGISVAVRVYERDGVAVVCGAWATDRQSTESIELNTWVIETGGVEMAGDRLIQNLRYMHRVPYSDNISGQQANCATAGKPWKAAYDTAVPVVRFPRLAFATDDLIIANTVVFRPGRREDIAR